jgi:DNA-directed RNA polymerase sigma subunit (sigma70/sigma32)
VTDGERSARSEAAAAKREELATRRAAAAEERKQRARTMYARYLEGLTMAEVGREFGISGERVRQLFALAGLPSRRGRRQ